MKTFRTILITVILLITSCTHPYEEGMMGIFPYFEMEDGMSFSFDAVNSSKLSGEVSVFTNMSLSASVEYHDKRAADWIINVDFAPAGAGVTVFSFEVAENLKRSPRSAEIKIYADGGFTGCVIEVKQDAYEITGQPMIHVGSMILRNMSDVEDCIYTDITGDLVICGDEIKDLSSLSHLVRVGGSLIIEDCAALSDLGPLGNLDVSQLVLTRVHAGQLLSGFSGSFNALTIEAPYDHPFLLSGLEEFDTLGSLILKGVRVDDLKSLLPMRGLEYLYVSECAVSEPELRYVEALRPDLIVETSDLADDSEITVSVSDYAGGGKQWFGMYLHISGYPSLDEVGYVINPSGSSFDFEKRAAFDEWYYADTDFAIEGLVPGIEYSICTYACGTGGRIYLSEPLTFVIER